MAREWTGDRLALLPRLVFLVVVLITTGVFVGVGWSMHNFHEAWNILLAIDSPSGKHSVFRFALSALGYLLLPTVIGLAVADSITRFTRKRLLTAPEAKAQIGEIVQEHLHAREEAACPNTERIAKSDKPGTTI
jgi:hypothetical protein